MNIKPKQKIPEGLRRALSDAGKKGWQARVNKAKKVADPTALERRKSLKKNV